MAAAAIRAAGRRARHGPARRAACACLALALALCLPRPGVAGPSYDTRSIPAGLITRETHAVVRTDDRTFTVEGPGRARERVHRAVTILDVDGRGYAGVFIPYDRFRHVGLLEGALFDAGGKLVRNLGGSDIVDFAAIQSFSLYEDNRVRGAGVEYRTYPYTVLFDYEVIHESLLGWPTWHPQESLIPVERASFTLDVPTDFKFRHQARNLSVEPVIKPGGKRTVWRWETTALPAIEPEPLSPGWTEVLPTLLLAPDQFVFGDHPGDLSSWAAFGKWYLDLGAGRQQLPEAARQEVERIAAAASSPREKVRFLYEHLQQTTRYVNVTLGIGGFQPYDAAYVFERHYGDCKALTNYMQSMLQAVGIPCRPALALAGADQPEIPADFPCQMFNHVMLCVPLDPDTIWLECTSQKNPFGHLSTFNDDRNVLVITPEGGLLRRTPASRSVDNGQTLNATVHLDAIGRARVEMTARYTGDQQDRMRGALTNLLPRDRESWLQRELGVPSFQLLSSDFTEAGERGLELSLSLTAEIMGAATRSGSRWFLRPSLLDHWGSVPAEVESRKTPVSLAYPWVDTDTVTFVLPAGLTVEAVPDPVSLETRFGSYRAWSEVGTSAIRFTRRLEMFRKRFPPQDYADYRAFASAVLKADDAQVVLVAP